MKTLYLDLVLWAGDGGLLFLPLGGNGKFGMIPILMWGGG